MEIGAVALQKAANQDLAVNAINQFGEKVENTISDGNISAYSSKTGSLVVTGGKLNLAAEDIDNVIVVTVTQPSTGHDNENFQSSCGKFCD